MRAPNIVLINCDDLGYGDLGCYGSPVNDTPALDRLADEGTRFTDFHMAASVCSPSRGAMLTGCYPTRIGFGEFDGRWVLFPGQPVGLNPSEVTIAQVLKERGYATQIVGKWHCGDQREFLPTRFGFDGHYGLPYSNDMGLITRYPHYPPLPLLDGEEVVQEQPDQASLTERYVERSVRFMRENRARPFFLYFAHMYVHVPLYTPERFKEASRNGMFGAAVGCVDWATDALLHELRRLGLEEDTLVVFTSDNGGNGHNGCSNAPLRGTKGTTWEGGMRVPFIARWPGHVPAGRTNDATISSLDILPTFASLAGGAPPRDRVIDGRDVASLLRGETETLPPDDAFFYYFREALDAVRVGPWKLFCARYDHEAKADVREVELYNLDDDIAETTNVADAHPGIVRDLSARLDAMRRELGDSRTGVEGTGRRPVGRVAQGVTLTERDLGHPHIVAAYDTVP